MKYDYSIICPSIRVNNLVTVYDSIKKSYSGSSELVVVSPYDLPSPLQGKEDVKIINSWASPIACQQIGLQECEGKYISWAADDGWYLPNALDVAFKHLESTPNSVVVGKYNEGPQNPHMNKMEYYYFGKHDGSRARFSPTDCLMLMCGVVSRETLLEVGGWDAESFEVCPMAYIDLSIRLYHKKMNFIFQEEMMFCCSHTPGLTGDHGPIHLAQTLHDSPYFKIIYSKPESQQRINIDMDNWKKAPDKWTRRFK